MEYVIGGTIIRTIGIDLTLKCISTITSSAHSIYGLISGLTSGPRPQDVVTVLKKLDIEQKVRVLESLIKNLRLGKHSETLSLCLDGLKQCLNNIEAELVIVQNRVTYNHSLWFFKGWRAWSFDDCIINLTTFNDMLESRRNMFFEVLKVDNELISEESLIFIKEQKTMDVKPNLVKSKLCATTSDFLLDDSLVFDNSQIVRIREPTKSHQ